MQTEQWRDINGYQGLYSVSNLGRVKSHARRDRLGHWRPARILKPSHIRGYPAVSLYRDCKQKVFTVHPLVLRAFVGWRPVGCEGAHQNGIRADSRLINLAWKTKEQNDADKAAHGTTPRGESHGNAKLTDASVRAICADTSGRPQHEIADQFDVSQTAVSQIRRRETWRHIPRDACADSPRGGSNPGEHNGRAKLTNDSVLAIRARPAELLRVLAAEFGVSETTVSSVRLRKIWRHLADERAA